LADLLKADDSDLRAAVANPYAHGNADADANVNANANAVTGAVANADDASVHRASLHRRVWYPVLLLIHCAISLMPTVTPCTTWCGHTFDLYTLLEYGAEQRRNRLPFCCPVCRGELDNVALNTGLAQLVRDFIAQFGPPQELRELCDETVNVDLLVRLSEAGIHTAVGDAVINHFLEAETDHIDRRRLDLLAIRHRAFDGR